jgi:acetylornithine/succinyldiaminopimelate/putrescine aminotransferase
MHGTTFGGGPLQCRIALKVLEIMERPSFLAHVREVGTYFRAQLEALRAELPIIREVRGEGLILAIELEISGKSVVRQALEAGVIINCTQDKVLRFLPPLIIEPRHVDELVRVLRPILATLSPAVTIKGANA